MRQWSWILFLAEKVALGGRKGYCVLMYGQATASRWHRKVCFPSFFKKRSRSVAVLILGKIEVFSRLVWRRVSLSFGFIILLLGYIVSGCNTVNQKGLKRPYAF